MIFRYDFGLNLDLEAFKRQSQNYIKRFPEISYHLFLPNYKLTADILKTQDELVTDMESYNVTLTLFDLKRDSDGDIINSSKIIPLNDIRFAELKDIIRFFSIDNSNGFFNENYPDKVPDSICRIVKILNKIDKLKPFIWGNDYFYSR